jgi:hypothetical protein
MKINKRFKILATTCGVLIAIYLAVFVMCFDVLSSPVRNNTHGWLGPAIRGDSHSVDIGKVYYYQGTNYYSYRVFKPLCKAWLWVNGV